MCRVKSGRVGGVRVLRARADDVTRPTVQPLRLALRADVAYPARWPLLTR